MCLFAICLATFNLRAEANRVFNGSFELPPNGSMAPTGWSASGNPGVKQRLVFDTGRDGTRSAKLECTEFNGDGPDYHAMISQAGHVAVNRGQWYRLSFLAKGQGIKGAAVEVALSDTRAWANAGLANAFQAEEGWEHFEFLFRANRDLPAAASRLQFWFKSTGTLWLDDVEIVESAQGQQWFPQITTEGVANFIPNSSFECGPAAWGSYTWGLGGWAGNLYRLEGEIDRTEHQHGEQSLKISLTPATLPWFWFDYYEPVRQPVRRVLVANRGWLRVRPGEPLTLSAFLRTDVDAVTTQLAAVSPGDRRITKAITIGREWTRQELTFTPSQPFLFVAVGLDLEASQCDAATLWVDAIQLERGSGATAYQPRQSVEAFLEPNVATGVFTEPTAGAAFTVRGFNDTDTPKTIHGRLALTDFFDECVFRTEPELELPPHSGGQRVLKNLAADRLGFFRARWSADTGSNVLRCAIIEPAPPYRTDSPLGFNHAYPWDFLVRLAHEAGVIWWRDWSAKWQTVEPEPGRFDWTVPDQQIHRVLAMDGAVNVLLPFPSTSWSTTARTEEVNRAAGTDRYLGARLRLAYAPKDLQDFGRYAAATVRHYREHQPRGVTHFQVLNEPVYTDYALPQKFGYTLEDYLRLLAIASEAIKTADPQALVVGGLSSNLESKWTRDFVQQGGLKFVDVFDIHNYDPARPAESFEDSFRLLAELMRAHNATQPVWITEWGCYADDDPPCIPQTIGDATMNRCRWPSERAATEHIVKYTAVAFAYGVRKIFFHAGTCGAINGTDAGGVLFEYGGAPRRMFAGVSVLTRLLGVPEACEGIVKRDGTRGYLFRTDGRTVAIAWWTGPGKRPLRSFTDITAVDIMGNPIAPDTAELSKTPIYLIAARAELVDQALP